MTRSLSRTTIFLIPSLFAFASISHATTWDLEARFDGYFPVPDLRVGQSVALTATQTLVSAPTVSRVGDIHVYNEGNTDRAVFLNPDDDRNYNKFGNAVGISGTTAIVGAYSDDSLQTNGGSAYLFDTTTRMQIGKLTADVVHPQAQFGFSVAIDGTTAIVGANRDSALGAYNGAAYLFDTSNGNQLALLDPKERSGIESFGFSVAISGTGAIVGAPEYSGASFKSGAAYLFDTITGDKIARLDTSDSSAVSQLGFSVGISGTTAIVGAPKADSDTANRSGAAYLFDTLTGHQIAKLTAEDAATFDLFGASVAISGKNAIIGAMNNNGVGAAYVFDIETFEQVAKLTADVPSPAALFGSSVAIFGGRAVVGAPNDLGPRGRDYTGGAYLFTASPSTVPVPPALWLALSGLGLLGAVRRQFSNQPI